MIYRQRMGGWRQGALSAAAAAQREPPRRKESGRGAEIGHGHVCADEQEGEKTTKSAAQESINPQ